MSIYIFCSFAIFFSFFAFFFYWLRLGSIYVFSIQILCQICGLVQFSHSVMSDSLQSHEPQHARPPCPSPLSEFTQTHDHWVSDAIQPFHPLLSPYPPALNLFQHQGLFNESIFCIRWPEYWSFSFNINPSKEHPGLTSFRMDWLDLLTLQGTLKSLLQHHSSKAPILWCSAFFIVQLSHPYMTTGKTIALTRWTFVDKVMSLLFNMLSRLDITFLPRSKRLLISWLQSSSAVISEPPKIKSDTVSTVSPSICHEAVWPDAMILVFWMLSFKPTFSLSSFTFIKRLFSSLLSALRVVWYAYIIFHIIPVFLSSYSVSSSSQKYLILMNPTLSVFFSSESWFWIKVKNFSFSLHTQNLLLHVFQSVL